MSTAIGTSPPAEQPTFDDLGTPLSEVTFVVVDLETTGGSPASAQITEIGAVKVRGGELLGEFQSLVNPEVPVPPFIAVLTGITDQMVACAPRLGCVLPAFLEFAKGGVLVAHNAPFDIGFLQAACARTGSEWPCAPVLDTARLARQVLTRDDASDCKLSTLARVFRANTVPVHRALADARATVDVLHGLLERLGSCQVHSLEELFGVLARVSPAQRRKRHLADSLPRGPGVYLFRDAQERVLYVGKATDLRARVRTYFTASEPRARMTEMIALTESVTSIRCATALEAEVRELRLIAEHKPPYNRRSRFPERVWWLKLTAEAFPRLSLVRKVLDDHGPYLGPFGSARQAERAMTAIHEAFPLRQCTSRLSPRRLSAACVLADMGRCNAPCDGRESQADYAVHVTAARAAIESDVRALVAALGSRIAMLSQSERFEEAAVHRDRLAAFVRAAARRQRLAALTRCPSLVAARPREGGWEVAVVRHGRLAGAAVAPSGARAREVADAVLAAAEVVVAGPGPTPAATAEESECILRWLESPGLRLVQLEGSWASPAYGAGRLRSWLAALDSPTARTAPLDHVRDLRPTHRPVAGWNDRGG